MQNPLDSMLQLVSFAVTMVTIGLIVVPYLMRKSDLFTWFNFFLAGSALFIGVSGIGAARGFHLKSYPPDVYYKYFFGLLVFFAALLATYWWLKLPRRLAGRAMRKWPETTTPCLVFLSVMATVILSLALIPIPLSFVRQLSFQLFVHTGPFAVVFALAAISRDRLNPVVWITFAIAIIVSSILSVSFGGGRRFAMATLMAIPIYFYWAWFRFKPITVQVTVFAISIAAVFMMLEGYDRVRHVQFVEASDLPVIEKLKRASAAAGPPRDIYHTSQLGAECTLLAIRMYSGQDRHFDGKLLHALRVILVNPIPRELWPNKPNSLGQFMPIQAQQKLGLTFYRNVTWGINPVGQGYHDGGIIVIALYGFLAAFALRFFDEMLVRQADNPFQMGLLASASGHVAGWPRGGIDTMTIQIIACVLSMLLLLLLSRVFLGAGRIYPKTDHIESFPLVGKLATLSHQH